jgi:hypothetical protein
MVSLPCFSGIEAGPILRMGFQSETVGIKVGSTWHAALLPTLTARPAVNLSNNLSSMRQCHTVNHKSELS